ncbi:hypothetical protein GCM10027062_23930 [Nocardioides hungaricus]
MSPRLSILAAVLLALALGTGASSAVAMAPERPAAERSGNPPSVFLEQLPESSVVGDGAVLDVEQAGDTVYAYGAFTEIGRYSGPGRILDGATGADRPAPVFGDGQVSVALADGSGGWYVAGDARGGVVHVLADGSVDPAFEVGVGADGLVSAIVRDGDTLYIGGLFDDVNGAARTNLAAVSATSGAVLAFTADVPRRVAELAVDADSLWVASADTVSALDKGTGAARISTAFGQDVRALALGDGVVYVGEDGLRAIDAESGEPVDGFADAVVDGTVHALLLAGGRLYVGTDGTDGSSKLIAVDPETGAKVASFDARVSGGTGSFGAPGGVYDLALDGDRLWVGGAFASAGGERGNLAVLDAATGAALDVDVPSFHEQVNTVEVSGGAVYVGGHFYLRDPQRTRGLAALDAETLEPVRGFRAQAQRAYGELTVAPNALYVAPRHFLGYDSRMPYYRPSTDTIRAFDPKTGAADPKRTLTKVEDLTGLTVLGSRLVVAQRLRDDVRFPSNRITVYRPNGAKAWSFKVPLRGYITNLDVVDGDLLVAGSFKRTAPNGGPRNTALLRLDPRTGQRRAYFDPRIDGPVNDVSVWGDAIYASGLFTKVHQGLDQDRPGLVRLDGRSTKSERFDPVVMGGTDWRQRAVAIGPDLVWADASPKNFLDATTGERVDLDGMIADPWLYDVDGDADTVVLGGRDWKSLAGQGYADIGFVMGLGY